MGRDTNQDEQEKAETVPALLEAAVQEPTAAQKLFALIYDELHALARRHMLCERSDHTLQPTALVHEAYLRLVKLDNIVWHGKAHFYIAAADAMRRILVDHARANGTAKRGGDWSAISLNLNDLAAGEKLSELLAIDEALEQLNKRDPQAAQVVRLRFFGGLSIDEIARTLETSPRSVDRDWQYARTWLRKQLAEGNSAETSA